MSDSPVALWYWRYHAISYDLFDSEEEAARVGVYMQDDGGASVAGVQFPDGRTVDRDQWPAWKTATERMFQAEREERQRQASTPPRPTRKVRAPFSDRVIEIDADEPDWIGQRVTAGS